MKTQLKLQLLVLLAALSLPSLAPAQGTAFNYQGRLVQNDVPASGLYDFIFTLHDAEVEGNTLGGPVTLDGVMVNDGQLVASLDFGAGVFTGAARWLEVSVRPAGAASYTLLNPRQAIAPTPYAIYAGTAGSLTEGTVTANQLDTGGIAPTPGQFLSYDGGNFVWSNPGPNNIFSLNGNSAYYNAGNVGIGTASPETKFAVFSSGYGIEQTDGTRRLSTYLSETGGWLGTRTAHPLNFYVNSGVASLTIATSGSLGIGTTTPTSKLEIVAQDGLKISGFQPFLTLHDSNAGNARGRIQSANGGIILQPESYISGSNPGAAVVIANSGFVGIGTITPVAKLHAETPLANTAAVYGKATGSGGVGVYGQSANGAAVHAEGNAVQPRDKGGFVKAMAYIDPFLPAAQYVVRCYNSQLTGNAASTSPCGITVTRTGVGFYTINFGFNVQDRFISLTPQAYANVVNGNGNVAVGSITAVSGSQVDVAFFRITGDTVNDDSRFPIVVY